MRTFDEKMSFFTVVGLKGMAGLCLLHGDQPSTDHQLRLSGGKPKPRTRSVPGEPKPRTRSVPGEPKPRTRSVPGKP